MQQLRQNSRTLITLWVAALLIAVITAGCNQHTDKIGDINNNPDKYMRHDVTIAGEVTQVYELPLGITNLAAYRVSDDTGQCWVFSHNGAPMRGDKVGLKGRVEPVADLGSGVGISSLSHIFGTIIQEEQRKTR